MSSELLTGLAEVRQEHLPMLLAWRNHESIRRYMRQQKRIEEEEHANWWQRLSNDPSRLAYVYLRESVACGFMQLAPTDQAPDWLEWGFYAAPGAPRGTENRFAGRPLPLHSPS